MSNQSNNKLFKNPIDAFTINSAREMHRLTTGSRNPPVLKVHQPNSENGPASIPNLNRDPAPDPIPTPTTAPTPAPFLVPATPSPHCRNPLCKDCGKVIIPAPDATFPVQDTPSICINNKWCILTQRLPILNAQEIEEFEAILEGIPVPEMIFGNNKVEVFTVDKKFHIMFNTLDALKLVERNPSTLIKVSYANEWFKSRQLKHANSENVSLEMYKPYDWTYTSHYKGTVLSGEGAWIVDNDREIPLDKLSSNNPIKFYDDMILYEDELGDNGISVLNIKIRVMSNCLLILQRLFIRVDEVLVRIIDTRLYIDFDTGLIIREQKLMQDDYQNVLAKASGPDKKKWLRDNNWCSVNLPILQVQREYQIVD